MVSMQEFVIDSFGLCWFLPQHSIAIDVSSTAVAHKHLSQMHKQTCMLCQGIISVAIMIKELLSLCVLSALMLNLMLIKLMVYFLC